MTENTQASGPAESQGYVIDAENAAEMARLMRQERLLTEELGGVVPEPIDLSRVHRVLDLACGPGGWLLDLTAQFSHLQAVGVDISELMIVYANNLAATGGRANVSFQVMDVTQHPLQFSDATFDLVNARILTGFLATNRWPTLVQECARITQAGGILRLTEVEWGITNSPAYDTLTGLAALANYRAGHSFSPQGRTFGTTTMLTSFLRQAGYQNVQHRAYAVDYSAGARAYQENVHNYLIFYKLIQPFLVGMQVATKEELEQAYEQMEREMLAENFCAVDLYVTAWGEKKT